MIPHPERGAEQAAAWFLVGPTASGKTGVAHVLAARLGTGIVSTDAMLVYRGMDIGTAKPTRGERAAFDYLGVDLADPADRFSVGRWLDSVRDRVRSDSLSKPRVVVGGTGLYVRALIEGLSPQVEPGPDCRAEVERLFADGGLPALCEALERQAPGRLQELADPRNPRRVARALEQAMEGGGFAAASWAARPRGVLAGLQWSAGDLAVRIERRARAMFEGGLVEEAAALRTREMPLSATALQAIGYREAFSVLDGACTVEEAIVKTAARTRALARRQRTWFRGQARVEWVTVSDDTTLEQAADAVLRIWEKHGPVAIGK